MPHDLAKPSIALSGALIEGPLRSISCSSCCNCKSLTTTAKRLGVENISTFKYDNLRASSCNAILSPRLEDNFCSSFGGNSSVPSSNKKFSVFMDMYFTQ